MDISDMLKGLKQTDSCERSSISIALSQLLRRPRADVRQPTHRYTRPFRNAAEYVPNLLAELKVWELKTNRYRGLFVTAEVEVRGTVTEGFRSSK
jgi:hypothetical protein